MNHPERITEEYLICPLCCCKRSLKGPSAMLSCGHTFCLKCLETKICPGPWDIRDVFCPVCCLPTSIPLDGLRDLPQSVFKEAQIDHLLSRNNAALGRDDALYCITGFKICPPLAKFHF